MVDHLKIVGVDKDKSTIIFSTNHIPMALLFYYYCCHYCHCDGCFGCCYCHHYYNIVIGSAASSNWTRILQNRKIEAKETESFKI